MSRFMNDKIGRKKKPIHLESLPLGQQLKIVLSQFDDPIEAVRDVLDPEHSYPVKSDLRVARPSPQHSSTGIFRVIYSTPSIDGKGVKIKSREFEAANGFDAKMHFEISKISAKDKSITHVIGTECLYVPRLVRDKFIKEFNLYEPIDKFNPLEQAAWLTLIEDLEVFEDDNPPVDLCKFINDE